MAAFAAKSWGSQARETLAAARDKQSEAAEVLFAGWTAASLVKPTLISIEEVKAATKTLEASTAKTETGYKDFKSKDLAEFASLT